MPVNDVTSINQDSQWERVDDLQHDHVRHTRVCLETKTVLRVDADQPEEEERDGAHTGTGR